MLLRIATAVVLIPVVVALVWWGPPEVLAAAAAAVALAALWEFFSLGERVGMLGFCKWTMVCAAGIFFAQYATGDVATHMLGAGDVLVRRGPLASVTLELVLIVFLFGAVAIGLGTRRPLQDVLPAIAVSSAGLLFVALPFSYLGRVFEVEGTMGAGEDGGRQLVLFTLFLVWAGDVLAYFVGKSLGRIPMAPALSPKKTWEGALGNVFASMITAVFFARWMRID